MSTVRAKFICNSVEPQEASEGESKGSSVTMSPVTSGSVENESFYKATPGGSVQLSIINEGAAEYFKVGQEYYIDFTLVE